MVDKKLAVQKRNRLLITLEKILEGPMILLGFVWLVLLIIEFINGFNPIMETISTIIWIIFVVDFGVKLLLAPEKLLFLKHNILTGISLVIPALRLFRIFRLIRLLRIFRGTRLIKVISGLNRSMRSLNATMEKRGFGYVVALTIAVILAGAAGMYTFEQDHAGLESYGVAVWWTTMLIITIGTDFWPQSVEGRILCTLLSLYGFAVFGYITATLASFFIGKDTNTRDKTAPHTTDIELLRLEIKQLTHIINQHSDYIKLKRSKKSD
ncbi:MAG TPA: ion transporter [Sphingobacteriaceae bacterium]